MSEVLLGERVGAIQSSEGSIVYLYGYGIYQGDEIPEEEENEMMHDMEIENPKILLDDGRIIWGFQCWWGPENIIKEKLANKTIIPV